MKIPITYYGGKQKLASAIIDKKGGQNNNEKDSD